MSLGSVRGRLLRFLQGPGESLGVLWSLWGVVGTLWRVLRMSLGVLRGVPGVPSGSLGDGSGKREVLNFLQVLQERPKTPIRHELSNLSSLVV